MTIQEQAQQLAALAEQVPVAHVQGLIAELANLGQQVSSVLGGAYGAEEIQGAINQAIEQFNSIGAAMENVKQAIASKAQYHQGS
ncbi:hypothetical protein NQK81_08970 [Amycolatopsis roodepoortensis]|uniref:hypothetical protein n=1 Tax=Amycolatopsis roodepoortensis TaxID=700274 RepID=UPI00214C3351|nr:hypothetical protein [Amycolatopsis roodepoortensis]UUV33567.1 hypothetical protein NQK81_08970 [Amycolatopsis roodepoortensis]